MENPHQSRGASFLGDFRPSHDQMYLASRLNDIAPKGRLTPAALQKLNEEFGRTRVTDALRVMRGFPPESGFTSSLYGYVAAICKEEA